MHSLHFFMTTHFYGSFEHFLTYLNVHLPLMCYVLKHSQQ